MSDRVQYHYFYCILFTNPNLQCHQRGYMDLVSEAAEASTKAAIQEVQSLPHYESGGEVRNIFISYSNHSLLDSG